MTHLRKTSRFRNPLLALLAAGLAACGGGSGDSGPTGFPALLLFRADDGITNDEPWPSDGTTAGTVQLKNIEGAGGGSEPGNFIRLGETVVFTAVTSADGQELWKTDGTTGGTVMVRDINPGGWSDPAELAAFD